MDVKLVLFKPSGHRRDFSLGNPVTVIGRGERCDLRVPILSVSRKHCELHLAGEQIKVKDSGSSNGTYVNNRRVSERALLPGDRLVVGPVVFTVQIDGQPEEIRPVKTRGQRLAEAGQPRAERIVDLEADVVAAPGSSLTEEDLMQPGETDVDPISALEMMATEDSKKKKGTSKS